MTDAELEAQIEQALQKAIEAPTKEEMREHWDAMASLINQRSPQQVRKMEEERGLR